MVRPRPDRRDHLFRLRGGEDELEVLRRFLDKLEQGVEALRGHHVRLVDDVDLVAAGNRGVERTLAQITGIVPTAVAGGVDLDDVDAAGTGRGERHARLAHAARIGRGAVDAVQGAGEDTRARRLAAAARAAEEVSVIDPATSESLPERLCDVVLATDFSEGGGAVLAVEGQAAALVGVFRHDLILAGRVAECRRNMKDPPRTRQSSRTLAAFRPWGGWQDKRRTGGWR